MAGRGLLRAAVVETNVAWIPKPPWLAFLALVFLPGSHLAAQEAPLPVDSIDAGGHVRTYAPYAPAMTPIHWPCSSSCMEGQAMGP